MLFLMTKTAFQQQIPLRMLFLMTKFQFLMTKVTITVQNTVLMTKLHSEWHFVIKILYFSLKKVFWTVIVVWNCELCHMRAFILTEIEAETDKNRLQRIVWCSHCSATLMPLVIVGIYQSVSVSFSVSVNTPEAWWLILTEHKRGRDQEEWFTLYYVEHVTLQRMWEPKWDQEFAYQAILHLTWWTYRGTYVVLYSLRCSVKCSV